MKNENELIINITDENEIIITAIIYNGMVYIKQPVYFRYLNCYEEFEESINKCYDDFEESSNYFGE